MVFLLIGLAIYDYFFFNDNYKHREKEKVTARDVNPFTQVKDVLKDKDLRSICILGMFTNATQPFLTLVLPFLFIDQMGLTNFHLGVVFFLFGFAHVFQYFLGMLSEKIGDRMSILIGVCTFCMTFLVLGFIKKYYVILIILFIKAFGGSLWNVTAWSYMSKIAEKKQMEGKVVGSYMALSRLSITTSFIVSGILLTFIKEYILLVYGGLIVIGLLFTYKKIGRLSVVL